VPTLVLGATADPATPVGNGRSVYAALDDAYLIIQQGGPHVIFARGEACIDDLVNAFLLDGTPPAQRETECPGSVMDDYVPLVARSARQYATLADAFVDLENELYYLPEYYYWDGSAEVNVGCARGGALTLTPDDAVYAFTLDGCQFLRDLALTGSGSQDPSTDTFTWDVTTTGRWNCDLHVERVESHLAITGTCGAEAVDLDEDL
jgi:hypothetical protein